MSFLALSSLLDMAGHELLEGSGQSDPYMNVSRQFWELTEQHNVLH